MFSKKSLLGVLAAGALALGASISRADTITVTSDGTPSAGVFVYDVSFSATAVVSNGDGFMIADFGPVLGTPSFSVLDGTPPASSNFTFSQPLGGGGSSGGVGLNGQTLPDSPATSTSDTFTNASNISTTVTDEPNLLDAVFVYNGPTFTASAGSDLLLTITSASTTAFLPIGTSLGVDNSGSGGDGLSIAESTVYVPVGGTGTLPAPLPQSLLGGGLLLVLLAGYQAKKSVVRA